MAFIQILPLRAGYLSLVGDVEHVAQHLHFLALLAFAQEGAHGDAQVLPQQIQHGALDGPLAFDHKFQLGNVQGLDSLAVIPLRPGAEAVNVPEHLTIGGHRLALHQRTHRVQALAGIFPAVDFPQAGVPGAVGQNDQVSGNAGSVGAGKGHEHTVIACHGDHLHLGYHRAVFHKSTS